MWYILSILLEVISSVKAWDLVPNSRSTLPWSSVVQVSVKEKRLLPYVVAIIWRNATVKSRVEKSFKVHGVTFLCEKNLLRYDRSTCPWSLQVNLHVKIGVEELFPKSEYRISDLTDKNIFVIKLKRKLEKTFLKAIVPNNKCSVKLRFISNQTVQCDWNLPSIFCLGYVLQFFLHGDVIFILIQWWICRDNDVFKIIFNDLCWSKLWGATPKFMH